MLTILYRHLKTLLHVVSVLMKEIGQRSRTKSLHTLYCYSIGLLQLTFQPNPNHSESDAATAMTIAQNHPLERTVHSCC